VKKYVLHMMHVVQVVPAIVRNKDEAVERVSNSMVY
jgi:hypothetical protein